MYLTSSQLADILNIGERRINQIAKEGTIFKRDLNGKFDAAKCVESYYLYKLAPDGETLNYNVEHTLLERAKREKAELELKLMKKELHRAEDVEACLTGMIIIFRNRMLGIPSQIAPVITGEKRTAKIQELLDLRIREALTELAEYDNDMFDQGDTPDYEDDDDEEPGETPEESS